MTALWTCPELRDILSAPHVIAIDNEKTEFSVGNNIPLTAPLHPPSPPTEATARGGNRSDGSVNKLTDQP